AFAASNEDVLFDLIKRHPDVPEWQLASAHKLTERGKQHLAQKQPAKAQADLEKAREIYARLLAKFPQARLTIALAMSDWQKEPGLAATRESEALVRLPNVEQKAWQAHWAEVEVLRKQFTSLPADKQVEEVREELKRRNPGFDGRLTHNIQAG